MTEFNRLVETARMLGITMEIVFVPWSQSPNAKPNAPWQERSLNWRATLRASSGAEILTTPYRFSLGHCPSYDEQLARQPTPAFIERMVRETETPCVRPGTNTVIQPSIEDVLGNVLSITEDVDDTTCESPAADLGTHPDSPLGQTTYHTRLSFVQALRAHLGEEGLRELRQATDW